MTTDMSAGPGAFRRLMNKVATWSEALNYSGFDYTLDWIAFVSVPLFVDAIVRFHKWSTMAGRWTGSGRNLIA